MIRRSVIPARWMAAVKLKADIDATSMSPFANGANIDELDWKCGNSTVYDVPRCFITPGTVNSTGIISKGTTVHAIRILGGSALRALAEVKQTTKSSTTLRRIQRTFFLPGRK